MKLNLGCGYKKLEGYINVDCTPIVEPDVVWDLNLLQWPVDANSIDEIVASHVLEHLTLSPVEVMCEIYRVLKPQAKCIIRLPHPRSDDFLNDPTHVRAYTPDTFGFFSKKICHQWIEAGWSNTPVALFHNIDLFPKDVKLTVKPNWSAKLGNDIQAIIQTAETFNNVISEFEITLVKDGKPNGDSETANA